MHVSQRELKLPARFLVLGLGILGAAVVAGTGGYLIKSASVTPIPAAPASISVPAAIPASAVATPGTATQTAVSAQPALQGQVEVDSGPVPATDQPAEVVEPATVAAAPADDLPEPGDVPDGE